MSLELLSLVSVCCNVVSDLFSFIAIVSFEYQVAVLLEGFAVFRYCYCLFCSKFLNVFIVCIAFFTK